MTYLLLKRNDLPSKHYFWESKLLQHTGHLIFGKFYNLSCPNFFFLLHVDNECFVDLYKRRWQVYSICWISFLYFYCFRETHQKILKIIWLIMVYGKCYLYDYRLGKFYLKIIIFNQRDILKTLSLSLVVERGRRIKALRKFVSISLD